MKLLFLIFLLRCGKPTTEKRCYTREEALLRCVVEEIERTGVNSSTARTLCETELPFEACYEL